MSCPPSSIPELPRDRPVGVFDSGVGGVSVLREVHAALPGEDLVYLADSGYAPYGGHPEAYIQARALACAEFLLARGSKAIVVACNTATAAAVHLLRERFAVPIVAMEPGIKPAAAVTRSGTIGVLATEATARSYRLMSLIDRYAQGHRVLVQPCPGLVDRIEHGESDDPQLYALLERYSRPLVEQGADALILGCTHYPLVRDLIARIVGPSVGIIDTGGAVARQVVRVLAGAQLLSAKEAGGLEFWTTGDVCQATRVISRHWGEAVAVCSAVGLGASVRAG